MLEPKKVKFKKIFKPKVSKNVLEQKSIVPHFGVYGLKVLSSGRITAKELDAARKAISKSLKKTGKLLMLVFPDKSVTKKPAEVRMGKGKGAVDHWVCLVNAGKILFELSGESITYKMAKEALALGGEKISLNTKLVINKV